MSAVQGREAVRQALSDPVPGQYDGILAVGKAAASMTLGALDVMPKTRQGLVITKYQHTEDELRHHGGIRIIESAHPVPDENSLEAGKAVVEFVSTLAPHSRLLVLVSGGASSLVEQLPDSLVLNDLQTLNKVMLAKGWDIHRMNRFRSHLSRIKAGKLWHNFKGQQIDVLAISDVQGDSIEVIGSGIGCPQSVDLGQIEWPDENLKGLQSKLLPSTMENRGSFSSTVEIVASNQIARDAAVDYARESGFNIQCNCESLYDDYVVCAKTIVNTLKAGGSGYYIWGGEPTVTLPETPGEGGRNQALALSIATRVRDLQGIHVLCAGTDGTDGPTNAAGALINCRTVENPDDAEAALAGADSGRYLKSRNALFVSGPTGTNVMDLVIAFKES